ncbi:hypothetical protein [Roseateles noduli]|uniref:hypothetical protein n=1 Tax=Roseateles noduli TaxID=2052484 RepID=UPI003D64E23D
MRVLLQTTIAADPDDWSIARFSLLKEFLASRRDGDGRPLYEVTARDRDPGPGPDAVLRSLDTSSFDQMWLFAVDVGNGLTPEDCDGIRRFHERGGGLMLTRDHMDLGSSLCGLDGWLGRAHHFHSRNEEPDEQRRCVDDTFTSSILWPNYHSGANGDYQEVRVMEPAHPVLRDPLSETGLLRDLPAHPHEGAVCSPGDDGGARAILQGTSRVSGNRFNLAVVSERTAEGGPVLAQSTFHHFCDFNWDVSKGSPSFVSEQPGDGMRRHPEALRSTQQYVQNVARWLGGKD